MTILQKFFILIVTIAVLSGAANGYLFWQLRKHVTVIDAQGSAIKLILETPEINAVVKQELNRRADALPTATTTKEK